MVRWGNLEVGSLFKKLHFLINLCWPQGAASMPYQCPTSLVNTLNTNIYSQWNGFRSHKGIENGRVRRKWIEVGRVQISCLYLMSLVVCAWLTQKEAPNIWNINNNNITTAKFTYLSNLVLIGHVRLADVGGCSFQSLELDFYSGSSGGWMSYGLCLDCHFHWLGTT